MTGFLSHVAYQPDLRGNAIVPAGATCRSTSAGRPAPTWLYAVTQGLHVNVGLVAVPLLLAKLWSVMPRLFAWPPITSPAQAIERLSIALLVASTVFQFVTGIMNAQYWYAFHFNFVRRALLRRDRVHGLAGAARDRQDAGHPARLPRARLAAAAARHLQPAPSRTTSPDSLAPADPDPPTISRRGLFAFVGGASALLLAANVGQTIGGPLRSLAFLAPRREDFPVNRTAARAKITPAMVGAAYRLTLASGAGEVALSREELLALPQHTARLPIACVEGWTTTQDWTGVRLSQLARAGRRRPGGRRRRVRALAAAGRACSRRRR